MKSMLPDFHFVAALPADLKGAASFDQLHCFLEAGGAGRG